MVSGDGDEVGQIPTAFFREALSLALEAVQARKSALERASLLSSPPAERAARTKHEKKSASLIVTAGNISPA
jgi:hypothetical protein